MVQVSIVKDRLSTHGDYYGSQLVSSIQSPLERKRKTEIERFQIHSTAISVDVDLSIPLFKSLFNWKKSIVSTLPIQVTELQEIEKRIEKMRAIETVFGMLNDLTKEQLETFETSIKRRPFFK